MIVFRTDSVVAGAKASYNESVVTAVTAAIVVAVSVNTTASVVEAVTDSTTAFVITGAAVSTSFHSHRCCCCCFYFSCSLFSSIFQESPNPAPKMRQVQVIFSRYFLFLSEAGPVNRFIWVPHCRDRARVT